MKALVDEVLAESPSVAHVVVWRRLGRDDVPMQADAMSSGTRPSRTAGRARAARGRLRTPRISSPTPPARPGGRRASCTCTAASSSRSRARSPNQGRWARPGDVIHFVTDMGWIMGPWEIVGGTAGGHDGGGGRAPDWPQPDRLWGLAESERVSILGISPTLTRADPPRRRVWPSATTSLCCACSSRPASPGTRSPLLLAVRASAAAAARSSTARAEPRSARFLSPTPCGAGIGRARSAALR